MITLTFVSILIVAMIIIAVALIAAVITAAVGAIFLLPVIADIAMVVLLCKLIFGKHKKKTTIEAK